MEISWSFANENDLSAEVYTSFHMEHDRGILSLTSSSFQGILT